MDVIERPVLDGARKTGGAFDGYVRSGTTVELKAFTGTTGDSGGFAVPREIDAAIASVLKSVSPIRSIANVVSVGSAGYRKLVTTGGTPSGWASETAARPETATPSFVELAPPMGELYANPSASQAMLDDAAFDVEGWLAGEIATEFARAEGQALVNGNGTNRPKGFLSNPISTAKDGVRPFGTLQYLATGAPGAFGPNQEERLVDLVQSLRAPYRQGACFVMNAATSARIRKMKTTDGQFLWAPGHARHRWRCLCDRLRQFPGRLPHCRTCRDRDPARPVQQQAVRDLLRDAAGRRLCQRLGGDQADEVRDELSA